MIRPTFARLRFNPSSALMANRQAIALLFFAGWVAVSGGPAISQDANNTRRNRKTGPPEKREVSLTTRDNVRLKASYYASEKGKDAIPIMIVHEWNGQSSPYADLATNLQKAGFAVLIPEYRGHGGSRAYIDRAGKTKMFETQRMSRRDVEAIILADLESAKGFLKEENNDEKLNLNALVLLGVREGCIMAAHWAQRDWAFPSVGKKKQGQDVKGLIFISPQKTFKGVAMDQAIRDPTLLQLPIMIVAGRGSKEAPEALRISKQVRTAKAKFNRGSVNNLIALTYPKSASGQELANLMQSGILKFVSSQVAVSEEENEWIERN